MRYRRKLNLITLPVELVEMVIYNLFFAFEKKMHRLVRKKLQYWYPQPGRSRSDLSPEQRKALRRMYQKIDENRK